MADTITLGTSASLLQKKLGQPLKSYLQDDYQVMQYGSISPSLATMYYIKDDKVAAVITNTYKSSVQLDYYLQKYGAPEKSQYRYSEKTTDSYGLIVLMWPQKGIAVVTAGNSSTSSVFSVQEFAPMSLNNYSQTFGKTFSSNQTVSLSNQVTNSTFTPTGNLSTPDIRNYLMDNKLQIVGLFLALIFSVFVLFKLIKKLSKK